MATLLFNLLSQDNPFDPSDRLLYKRDRNERRAARADRKADRKDARIDADILRDERNGNLTETSAEPTAEAIEAREAREKAEQERLAEESMAKVTAKTTLEKINADEVKRRITEKQEQGELTEEQLINLDTALDVLDRIEDFKSDPEVYDRMIAEFALNYSDLLLSADEIQVIQKMASERMELREAHATVDVNDLKSYSLLFIRDSEGIRANKSARKLSGGAKYTVDFIDPESGEINKIAQNKITLGHIMLGTNINSAIVTPKKDHKNMKAGVPVEAHLWTNGKTYNKPQHADDKTGLFYVPIYDGDVIETEVAATTTHREGNPNTTDSLLNYIAGQSDNLSGSETNAREELTLERAIEELKRGTRVHLPEALDGYKGKDYEAELAHMNVGPFLVEQLDEMSLIQGNGASATQMWTEIRKKCGRSGVVSFHEIIKVVLGEKSDLIFEKQIKSEREGSIEFEGDAMGDYEELRARQGVLRMMTELATANPEITLTELRAAIQANPPSGNPALDTTRLYLYNPYAGSPAKVSPEKLAAYLAVVESGVETYARAFLAAQNLLDAIPHLSPRKDVAAERRNYEKSPEVLQVVEPVMDALFPPDKTIDVNRRLFDELLFPNRTSDTANWENPGERAVYDKNAVYERVMSANAANNKLRNRVTDVEGQRETVDLVSFAKELENLRQLGFTESAEDTVFKTRYLQNYNRNANIVTPENLQDIMNGDPVEEVLHETTMKLIQRGMVVDQIKDVAEEREFVKKQVIESFTSPSTKDLLVQIAENPDVTAEQLREFGKNIDKVHLFVLGFSHTRHEEFIGKNQVPKSVEDLFGTSFSKPFKIGENTFITPTISNNVFTYELRGTLALSGSRRIGRRDRVKVGGSAGISYGPGEGAHAGIQGSVSYDLDKYHEWNIGVNAGVGVGVGSGKAIEGLSFAFLGFSLGRDLDGALLKDTDQFYEARETAMDAGLERLGRQFDEAQATTEHIEQVPKAQLDDMKDQLMDYYGERLKISSIEAMNKLQFTQLRVTFVGGVLPIPMGLVAFKGNTNSFFSKDPMTDLDAHAQHDIDQLGGGEAIELELSPGLTLGEGETRTYDREAGEFDPYGEYEKMVDSFAENQALQIERIGDNGEFSLGTMKLDGMVKVYPDEEAGVRTYPGPNGELYFSIAAGKRLSIHRVDTYYALPYGGHEQVTEIYISDNRMKSLDYIKATSDRHMSAEVSHRQTGTNTRFESVQHSLYNNEATVGEVTEWDLDDMKEAQGVLDKAMGSQVEVNISSDRQKVLTDLTTDIIGKVNFNFAATGTAASYDQMLLTQANKALELLGKDEHGPKTGAEKLFVLQTLLMKTRSAEPANINAFIDHVVGWNTRSLTATLEKQGVQDAGNISEKIMLHYGRQLRRSLHNGEPMQDVRVASGSVVQTQIGYAGLGNHMEFLNGSQNEPVALVGMMDMDQGNLELMGLTHKQANDFLSVKGWGQLKDSFDSPNKFFEHPITIGLLEEAATYFGPEYTKAFAEIASKRPSSKSDLTPEQLEAYNALAKVAASLEDYGSAYYKGRVIGLNKEAKMGFINACRNFTTTYRAAITGGGGGAAVDVVAGVHSNAGVTMGELGASVAYKGTKNHTPRRKKNLEANQDVNHDQDQHEEEDIDVVIERDWNAFPGIPDSTGDDF
jgi:hypothetical protein